MASSGLRMDSPVKHVWHDCWLAIALEGHHAVRTSLSFKGEASGGRPKVVRRFGIFGKSSRLPHAVTTN